MNDRAKPVGQASTSCVVMLASPQVGVLRSTSLRMPGIHNLRAIEPGHGHFTRERGRHKLMSFCCVLGSIYTGMPIPFGSKTEHARCPAGSREIHRWLQTQPCAKCNRGPTCIRHAERWSSCRPTPVRNGWSDAVNDGVCLELVPRTILWFSKGSSGAVRRGLSTLPLPTCTRGHCFESSDSTNCSAEQIVPPWFMT